MNLPSSNCLLIKSPSPRIMNSAKQTLPAREQPSSSVSVEKSGTSADIVEDLTDGNDEAPRQSEDREKRTPHQGQILSDTKPRPPGGSNIGPRLEDDSNHNSGKPPNQTRTDFFGLSTEDKPLSSTFERTKSYLEHQPKTPKPSSSRRVYSEDFATQSLSAVNSRNPTGPPAKQSGERHTAPYTFPRVRPSFNVPGPFQDQVWEVENLESEVSRNSRRPFKRQPPNSRQVFLGRPRANWGVAFPITDRNYAGNFTNPTRQDQVSQVTPQRGTLSPHSQILPGVTDNPYWSQQATLAATRSQSSNDMAAAFQRMSGDARRYPSSNYSRPENRPPMSNVLCRNGPQCRKFQEGDSDFIGLKNDADLQLTGTCNFNHDFSSISADVLGVSVIPSFRSPCPFS